MFSRLLWGSIVARRARVTLALLAVGLGSGMAVALGTLALQVGDDVARQLRAAGPNFLIQPRGATWTPDLGGAEIQAPRIAATLPEDAVATLKETFWRNNILQAAPELTLATGTDRGQFLLRGSWFEHSVPTEAGAWSTGLAGLHPTWRVNGRWPDERAEEVVLGRALAERLAARRGDRLTLHIGAETVSLAVTGILEAGGPEDQLAWAPLPLVQRLAARPGQVDRIWMSALVLPGRERPAPDPSDAKAYEKYMCTAYPSVVAASLSERLPGAEVVPATERIAGEARVVTRLTLLMVLLALAGIAASTLGLLSTMTTAVVERSSELALLRAIGASPGQLAALLLGETLLVALAGGALGWWLGEAGAAAIRGASFVGASAYRPLLLPVSLAVATLVALAGTLGPLRLALRLDPARVLRG
jgi:putative ABC transport system permease protein